MSDREDRYQDGYDAGWEAGRDSGYENGYEAGKDMYRDDYYRAVDEVEHVQNLADGFETRLENLVEWLKVHYPTAYDEFEKSTAVAERLEK